MYARYVPPPKLKPQPAFQAAETTPATTPRQSQVQTSTTNGSGSGQIPGSSVTQYARYIPPSKAGPSASPLSAPAPKKIVFNDDDFPVPEPKKRKRVGSEAHSEPSKKDSKSKKPKHTKEPAVDEAKSSSKGPREDKSPEDGDNNTKEEPTPSGAQETFPDTEETEGVQDALEDDAMSLDQPTSSQRSKSEKIKKKKKKVTAQDLKESAPDDGESDAELYQRHKSIFEKRDKAIKAVQPKQATEPGDEEERAEGGSIEAPVHQELHGLEPLPQPEAVAADEPKLEYETLPPWLASPIQVSSETRIALTDLGIASDVAKSLESSGIKDAFAVQAATFPLLLPGTKSQGDLLISAATGSGKTLAYVLPMVRDLSQGAVSGLRAIIVLPTRDLVDQVRKTCETCSAAFAGSGGKRVIVGEALGKNELKKEQSKIMETRQRYDPAGYDKYRQTRYAMVRTDEQDQNEETLYSLSRTTRPLPDHVIEHVPAVDILICTPGRLVEHIRNTPGFTLDYVRWLVVDEADKLLAQDFQDWLSTVVDKLDVYRPGARDFPGSNKSGVRKVILSATMTRDLSLLNNLKLSHPKLIVLDVELKLPDSLKESALRIRNPGLKPLYLLDLLEKLNSEGLASPAESQTREEQHASDSESSDSDSESSASDSSDSSNSSSPPRVLKRIVPPPAASKSFNTTVLIFTRSNESALRLSRLLALLSPDLAPFIGTLASATRSVQRERTIRAFTQGRTRILIASDLVSRGIDLPKLDHVINYDVPTNATSYVHRVGRTARAGRLGRAWTLLTHAEAYTFWSQFGGESKDEGTNKISRAGKVERVRIWSGEEEFAKERVDAYEQALAQLGQEAGEGRK